MCARLASIVFLLLNLNEVLTIDSQQPNPSYFLPPPLGEGRRNLMRIPTSPEEFRPCGEQITIFKKDDIEKIFDILIDNVSGQFSSFAKAAMARVFAFDIKATKICTSCKDMLEAYGDELTAYSGDDGFMSYCGPDTYGHDAIVSGVMLEPIHNDTGVVKVGKLKV